MSLLDEVASPTQSTQSAQPTQPTQPTQSGSLLDSVAGPAPSPVSTPTPGVSTSSQGSLLDQVQAEETQKATATANTNAPPASSFIDRTEAAFGHAADTLWHGVIGTPKEAPAPISPKEEIAGILRGRDVKDLSMSERGQLLGIGFRELSQRSLNSAFGPEASSHSTVSRAFDTARSWAASLGGTAAETASSFLTKSNAKLAGLAAIDPAIGGAVFSKQAIEGAKEAYQLAKASPTPENIEHFFMATAMIPLSVVGIGEAGEGLAGAGIERLRKGGPTTIPSGVPSGVPSEVPKTETRGTVPGERTVLRPTTQTTAGVAAPISALQQENAPLAARAAAKLTSPWAEARMQKEETAPAATRQLVSTVGQPAEDRMAKHDAIMNKEAMPESIAGTQTPSRFKTFDDIKQATEDKAQETYKKADQISAEEQQVYANKVAEATAENDAMWKRHLQNVKDYNDNLATGETPMAVPAEKPAPNIPERPLTYGEVKGALDRAKAESTSSDAAVREDAYNRIPKAEKAVDNWFKQHSDEISPEEYDSAKKLYASSQRFGDIANGLRSSLNKGTLTGNTLRGLEANIDNKMIRRGQAPGTFQRLLGPDAYDNWKNVSKLFDRAQNTPKSLGMYGAEWIAAHLLGPYGLAGKFATEFLLNRVLFDPAWGQWFGKFTTTMKNLMTRTHGELGLPGMVGEPFGEESPENLKGEFGRLMHQEAGTIPEDVMGHVQQGKPYAVLTAENPQYKQLSPEENAPRNAQLKQELLDRGYTPTEVTGQGGPKPENSFLVPGMGADEARELGAKHGQGDVITNQGMHNVATGELTPSKSVLTGDAARAQQYHTVVGNDAFSHQLMSPEEMSAREDYRVEDTFAKQFQAGEKSLKEFPYYKSYVDTVNDESKLIPKGSKVLFVGGGPVPLSSILFDKNGFDVDTLEIDPKTTEVGEATARKAGMKDGKFLTGDARAFDKYKDYDAIVVALEAGPEASSKNQVLQHIMSEVKPETKVLARGTNPGEGVAFVDTRANLPKDVTISKSIPTFDNLSQTHVLEPSKTFEAHHWSNVPNLTETDPAKMGTGMMGRESARMNEPGFEKRTNFGLEGYKERAIQGKPYHYVADLDKSKYYDAQADPDGLWMKGLREGGPTGAEKAVRDAGYHGYRMGNEVAAFEKTPVHPVTPTVGTAVGAAQDTAPFQQASSYKQQIAETEGTEGTEFNPEELGKEEPRGPQLANVHENEISPRTSEGVVPEDLLGLKSIDEADATKPRTVSSKSPISELRGRALGFKQKMAYAIQKYASGLNFPKDAWDKNPTGVIRRMTDHFANNLSWMYDMIPDVIKEPAKQWYESAHNLTKKISDETGVSHPKVAGVVSVLSPNNNWDNNLGNATRLINHWRNDIQKPWSPEMAEKLGDIYDTRGPATEEYPEGRPQPKGFLDALDAVRGKSYHELTAPDKATLQGYKGLWIRILDEVEGSPKTDIYSPIGEVRGSMSHAWPGLAPLTKALEILEGDGSTESISKAIGEGHKTRNFYNNLINPWSEHGHVTIDTHAVRAANLRALTRGSAEVNHNFGGSVKGVPKAPKSSEVGINGTYPIYDEAYRRVAEEKGLRPNQTQSVLWEGIRSLLGDSPETFQKPINDIWQKVQQGKLSAAAARQEILKVTGGFKKPAWVSQEAWDADTSSYKQQAEPQLGEPQHQMTSLGTHNVISADVNPPSLTPEVLKWRGQPQPKLAPDYSNLQDIANQMNANVTPEDILTSTAHELGHAFAQHFYGANSDNMSINLGHSVMDPTSETGPKTTAYGVSSGYLDPGGGWEKQYKEARSNPEKTKVFSENYLTGLMSGRAMEELLGIPPDRIQIHISNDMKMAQGLLRALDIPFNDYRPILQAATERARDIIRDNFDTFRHMTAQAVNHYGGEKIDAKTFHKYRQGGIYGK